MKRKIEREDLELITKRKREGKTDQEIADELGVHRLTINRWVRLLRESGVDVPSRVGKPPLIKKDPQK